MASLNIDPDRCTLITKPMFSTVFQAITRAIRLLEERRKELIRVILWSLLAALATSCYAAASGPLATLVFGVYVGEDPTRNWLQELPLSPLDLSQSGTVATILTALCALALLRALAGRELQVVTAKLEQNVAHRLRERIYAHALRAQTLGTHSESAGELGARVVHEVAYVSRLVTLGCVQLVWKGALSLTLCAVAFAVDPVVATCGILFLLSSLQLLRRPMSRTRAHMDEALKAQAALTGQTVEALEQVDVLRLYGAGPTALSRFEDQSQAVRDRIVDTVRAHTRVYPLLELLVFASLVVTAGLAYIRFESGNASVMGYTSLCCALLLMVRPVRQLAGMSHQMAVGLAAADRLDAFLSRPAEENSPSDRPSEVFASLACEGASVFGKERPRLHGVDLEVRAGEALLIVGASGAGKTTLLRMLMGLLPNEHGRLVIDGRTPSDLGHSAWREYFSWVPQQPRLLAGTALANIALGDPTPDRERAQSAAQDAGAAQFIEKLSEGYDTPLLEGGRSLSAGEIQRLCLARALYRGSPILVLDEPTSALDYGAEHHFLSLLQGLVGKKTIIMTSHRSRAMIAVDRVLVLDEGRVVDEGSPHDLIRQSGTFRSMFERE